MRILAIVLVVLTSRATAADALLTEASRIPLPKVGGRIDHFAEDMAGKRLFLAALGNDTVEVIDLAAGRVVRSIDGVKEPQGVGFVPALNRLVIAEGDGDVVDVMDGSTFERVGRIEHLDDADNVRVDAKTGLVYVGAGSGKSSALAKVDAKAASLVRQFALPGHPEAFALEEAGPRIYVNVPTDRSVVVLDRTSGATIARWALRDASSNFPMALDEAAHRLFIGCRSPATLLILDTTDGSIVGSVPCCGDADDVLLDATTHRIYVVGGEGVITVLSAADPKHYEAIGTIETASGARTGILASSGRVYIACPHRHFGPDAVVRVFQPAHP